MENPLLKKYYEIHPEKKEKPKLPKIEDYKGEKTIADELKELQGDFSVSVTTPTGTNIISATNASVSVKPKALQTYDVDSINDSFLHIAEKVKNKEAQVCTMNMDYEHQTRTQRITFEVLTNF